MIMDYVIYLARNTPHQDFTLLLNFEGGHSPAKRRKASVSKILKRGA